MNSVPAAALLTITAMCMNHAWGEISAVDDQGHVVTLSAPAQRIVSLAPHATEVLFAIGAGDQVVGAIEYSDYPEAARQIPRVGNHAALDIERIRVLAPDLVIAWSSGNSHQQLEKLRTLGIPVFVNEPHAISDVPATTEKLGVLTGMTAQAKAQADAFRERFSHLRTLYADRAPVRLFYQISQRPLMTVNGKQIISDAMRACGAVNIFADLLVLAPTVDVEAVLAANPEMIATSGMAEGKRAWLEAWRQWPHLQAVAKQNLVALPPDLLNRLGPRIVDGIEKLCDAVEDVRRKRGR